VNSRSLRAKVVAASLAIPFSLLDPLTPRLMFTQLVSEKTHVEEAHSFVKHSVQSLVYK
jgi:hypothetical protein